MECGSLCCSTWTVRLLQLGNGIREINGSVLWKLSLRLLMGSLLVANVAVSSVKLEWGSSSPGPKSPAFPPGRLAVGKEHWETAGETPGAFLPGGGEREAGHLEKAHKRWVHQPSVRNVLWEMVPKLRKNGPGEEGHRDTGITTSLRSCIGTSVKVRVRWPQRPCAHRCVRTWLLVLHLWF